MNTIIPDSDRVSFTLQEYFAATLNGFFSPEARKNILGLFCRANAPVDPGKLLPAVREMEHFAIRSPADCMSYLSSTFLFGDSFAYNRTAAQALLTFLLSEDGKTAAVYATAAEWRRNVLGECRPASRTLLIRAMIAYTERREAEVDTLLEKLACCGGAWSCGAFALLAVTAMESGNTERAYEAVCRDELVFRPETQDFLTVENESLAAIRSSCLAQLGEVRARSILDNAKRTFVNKTRFGFC